MKLEFTKMHGLGNDMIVINSLESGFLPTNEQARALCDRRLGVGADQALILLPSENADFKMLIFNNDGSEVEMCGNGIRCLARYLADRGLSDQNPLTIETLAGPIKPEIVGDLVRVDMGEPIFEAAEIPVQGEGKIINKLMPVDGEAFNVSAVSMGNPHCVIKVDEADKIPLEVFGPMVERHPWFPNRVNAEFVQVIDRGHLRARVWERGAGITLACGTGACAAGVAMMDLDHVDRKVIVSLPGGDLEIEWDQANNHVWMTGPAVEVFQGVIEI